MNRKLLFSVTKKNLDITWFSGTGGGGQYRNKHQNCCRIKHRDSGVIVTGQEERSQKQNLKNAFLRLTKHPDFKRWLRIKTARLFVDKEKEKMELQEKIKRMMKPENLKIEYL